MNESDQHLISRCLAGDDAAAESLYRRHAGRVAAYLLRSGFDWADVEDLTQAVFYRAFRSLGTFDAARGGFRTWLGAIARNAARKQWSGRAGGSFDPELADEMFAAADNPGQSPEALEEAEAVRACVSALPEQLARVVRLRYVDGLTTRGIAESTQMPEATVRLRLSQALGSLKTCLKAKGVRL